MSGAASSLIFTTAACLLTWLFVRRYRKQHSQLRLPPGPKPLPLLGNVLDMPRKNEWETLSRWREIYGDVVFVSIIGRPMIVLNSFEAATALLGERSVIYSDRPRFPLVDLVGHHFNFGFMPYGKRWQACRRIFAGKYSKAALHAYHDSHRGSVMSLLRNLLHNPENFVDHLRLHAGQLIIDVTYGIPITSRDDMLIKTAEAVMKTISIAVSPAMWVINPVPIMQALPTWLGGKNLSWYIRKWQADLQILQTVPFQRVKAAMTEGTAKPSFTSTLLQEEDFTVDREREILIRDCAAVAYGGGSDTTVSSATVFLLAMVMNPRVQKTAQAEIDRVVGLGRLPDFVDQPKLPYITAIMKEMFRWHPPAPQGIPHQLTKDDEYKGYNIPAGTMVIGNIWGILHDPSIYPNPSEFKPERYLDSMGQLDFSVVPDPARIAFGFGRRACPGHLFAEDALWLMLAQLLSVFWISPSEKGSAPSARFTSGAISHPVPFSCNIGPRSEMAMAMLLINR